MKTKKPCARCLEDRIAAKATYDKVTQDFKDTIRSQEVYTQSARVEQTAYNERRNIEHKAEVDKLKTELTHLHNKIDQERFLAIQKVSRRRKALAWTLGALPFVGLEVADLIGPESIGCKVVETSIVLGALAILNMIRIKTNG